MNLDIGAVISQTFSMIKQRFGGLLGLWVIYFVIQMAMTVLLFGAVGAQFAMLGAGGVDEANPLGAMGFGFIASMVVFYLAYLLLSFASSVSLTHHASSLHSPEFGGSFSAGFKSIPTLLGLVLIFFVAYILLVIVLGIIVGILSILGEFGATLGALLAAFIILYLMCRLILTMPIIAVEGERNPINAITRSWALTSGNVLRIFLTVLGFTVLMVVVVFAIMAIFGGGIASMASLADPTAGPESMGAVLGAFGFIMLAFVVLSALAAMVAASFMASLHAGLAPDVSVSETFS